MIAIVSAAGKMRIKICNGKMVSENSNIKRVIKAAFPTNFNSFFICLCILTPSNFYNFLEKCMIGKE